MTESMEREKTRSMDVMSVSMVYSLRSKAPAMILVCIPVRPMSLDKLISSS